MAQYQDTIVVGQSFIGNTDGDFENVYVTVAEVCNLHNDKYDILVHRIDGGKDLLIDEKTFRELFVLDRK